MAIANPAMPKAILPWEAADDICKDAEPLTLRWKGIKEVIDESGDLARLRRGEDAIMPREVRRRLDVKDKLSTKKKAIVWIGAPIEATSPSTSLKPRSQARVPPIVAGIKAAGDLEKSRTRRIFSIAASRE
jgi:hypothetical protein